MSQAPGTELLGDRLRVGSDSRDLVVRPEENGDRSNQRSVATRHTGSLSPLDESTGTASVGWMLQDESSRPSPAISILIGLARSRCSVVITQRPHLPRSRCAAAGKTGRAVIRDDYSGGVLLRLVMISRPVLWVNTIGTTAIAMWLAGALWRWDAIPLLLWATLPFNLLIYGVNDIFDQETDALNSRKGGLEGARIAASESRHILAAVVLTNVPFVAYFLFVLPLDALAWILAYIVIFVQYSAPPLRFKARSYLDALSNAAYAFPLVFVPLAFGESPVWAAAIGLMAWSVAKHTFDAIQDIDVDRAAGIVTTAVRLGPHRAMLWSTVWWSLSTVCFAFVNIPVAVANALIAGWLLLRLRRDPTPNGARRLYRYSIAFPYAAGSVAGVQIVASLLLGGSS
jgi:4-hydroxybenzoate polyprenyltransferase